MNFFKKYWLLILILLVAIFVRLYRTETLTSFQDDQGRDLTAVYKMVSSNHITLLGSPSTFGPFQGPLYYYLLVPSMFLSHSYPIGPLIFAVLWNILGIVALYLFCQRFLSKKIGIIASFLYALSPLLVETGRTLLNAYFGLPIIISALYLVMILVVEKKFKVFYCLLLGFLAGSLVQLHYNFVPFVIFCFLIPLFSLKGNKANYYLLMMVSFFVASFPQILFEFTHGFLSTNLLISSLGTGKAMTLLIPNAFNFFFSMIGYLFGFQSFWYGVAIIVMVVIGLRNKLNNVMKWLLAFFVVFMTVALLSKVRLESFHYYMSIYPVILIFAAIVISRLSKIIQLLFFALFILSSIYSLDLGRNHGFTMVPNWSLACEQKVAEIIASDVKGEQKWNVAEVLDGDTIALHLKYLLSIRGAGNYMGVEEYPKSKILYLVSWEKPENLVNSNVWEITSLKPFRFAKSWQLQKGINLYRIEREAKP